uniref:DUF488 domain-containing protein n=1 Tax=Candidatus Kentrum sp. TC TaxID=2126339 RepID=A0A450YX83_9GAMM|nr:MAG: Protein of unknown function, DUF488 [Candidatus Kentron sp. TC]
MKTYTIGFTQKNAHQFFEIIRRNDIARIVDVRLNNVSQLAGFAKRDDLRYFLAELCGADYVHVKELAPTKDILDAYKKKAITWAAYEDRFFDLMSRRNVERAVDKAILENGCLLCSEHEPDHCHRRLVLEYLNRHWDTPIEVAHLT